MKHLITLIMLGGFVTFGWLVWDLQKKVATTPVEIKGAPAAYRMALGRARSENKPVLLIFTASWCGPCQMMKDQVYPSAPVRAEAGRYIWHFVDVDQPANEALIKHFGTSGIPALVIVDPMGRKKSRIVGGRSPQSLAKWLSDNS
jgi:thiol:disulfide interchange protein